MQSLPITDSTHVIVLTGAGVSAESGIPTFRRAAGLWEEHKVEDVASFDGFVRDPKLVWRFYSERRKAVLAVEPNPGHLALAALADRLGDRLLLTTQNVDGLHQRAGSKNVVELHGNLLYTRCASCDRPPFYDEDLYTSTIPMCGKCEAQGRAALLRPHIVWFGEALDPAVLHAIESFIQKAKGDLLFLAIGTSGAVYPAASFVDWCKAAGGKTYLINLDESDNVSAFDEVIIGKSGDVLPTLLAP